MSTYCVCQVLTTRFRTELVIKLVFRTLIQIKPELRIKPSILDDLKGELIIMMIFGLEGMCKFVNMEYLECAHVRKTLWNLRLKDNEENELALGQYHFNLEIKMDHGVFN